MLKHYSWFPVPKHAIEKHGKMTDRNTRWTRPANMVCNGPFKLKSWAVNQAVEVERNPHYWDAATVKLNGIVSSPSPATPPRNSRSMTASFTSHSRCRCPRSPSIARRNHPSSTLTRCSACTCIAATPPRNPSTIARASCPCSRHRPRQHRSQHSPGRTTTRHRPHAAGCNPDYKVPNIMRFDPVEARRLLAEAGFPDGKDFPPFDILIKHQRIPSCARRAVQAMWKQHLKVPAGVLNQDWGVYLESQRKFDYQIARFGWSATTSIPPPSSPSGRPATAQQHRLGQQALRRTHQSSFREAMPPNACNFLSEAETFCSTKRPCCPFTGTRAPI
jgi:oligopeptide transport system substrate-binding protein